MPHCIDLRVQFLVAGFKSLEFLFQADIALIHADFALKQESRLLNPATRNGAVSCCRIVLNQEVFFLPVLFSSSWTESFSFWLRWLGRHSTSRIWRIFAIDSSKNLNSFRQTVLGECYEQSTKSHDEATLEGERGHFKSGAVNFVIFLVKNSQECATSENFKAVGTIQR